MERRIHEQPPPCPSAGQEPKCCERRSAGTAPAPQERGRILYWRQEI
jgi:hypothetical protein